MERSLPSIEFEKAMKFSFLRNTTDWRMTGDIALGKRI
jgi:hypothetical protein